MNPLTTARPSTDLSLSVVVCCYTFDRWADVVRGLVSLSDQERRPDQVVVVVDHNDALLERIRDLVQWSQMTIDVVANSGERGLSGARNSGVAVATSDIIAFLDDDAAAAPGWVSDMLAAYAEPDVWGVGGAADPVWNGGAPAWFPEEFGWVVGCSYTGQPLAPAPVRNFLGCNMSFRREVFELVGGFREGIGRVGTNPVGCEETELCIRLRQAEPAARLVYDPKVRVRHRVSDDRHAFRYFRARCRAEGRSKALVSGEVGSGDALETERAYTTRVLPLGVVRGVTDLFRGDVSGLRRAGAICIGLLWTTAGYVSGRARGARITPVPATQPAIDEDLVAA